MVRPLQRYGTRRSHRYAAPSLSNSHNRCTHAACADIVLALSDNFQKVYPEAYGFFQQHPNEAPICVSLGPEGSYFINTAGGSSRKFPAKIEEDFKDVDIAKFESVWLGCGGAYFVQAKTAGGENGNATWARYWNLQGQYPGLAKVARLRGKQVKLTVCMS